MSCPRWRRVLAGLLCALCWWLLLGSSLRTGGAALGLLAAGGWGLGLVPVHSNRLLTGPRRRTSEPVEPGPVSFDQG
ncbi:hypothetical protein [Kitasatospora atroaurantiaca]|uniref:hypothetical protein n=1 Tax=Kitasatospora atroaurantiaca TaxID=285545 RepID=UPI0014797F07|nr:hypothetical protein [Kitasatospora atroaurantiaca]